jgi:hypothetical protein
VVSEDRSIGFPDDEPNVVIEEPPVVEAAPVVAGAGRPWYRQRWPLLAIALAVVVAIAALLFNNGRTDQATSGKRSAPGLTVKQYIEESGITSTQVRPGDPGAPKIVIALPQGWSDLGPDTPEWAYGAVQDDTSPDPDDPPTITVLLSKLTGDVDPAKILEYAPGELMNLPNYVAANQPITDKLSGFDAVQLAGLYERDGTQRTIAQKTVVIPANDAVYVLQMNADALKSDAIDLMMATDVIDKQTTITP